MEEKMKLEAIKRQGAKHDVTSPQLAAKFRADDTAAKVSSVSLFDLISIGIPLPIPMLTEGGAAMMVESTPQKSENARLSITSVMVAISDRSYKFCMCPHNCRLVQVYSEPFK
jgi:hypothetical protein